MSDIDRRVSDVDRRVSDVDRKGSDIFTHVADVEKCRQLTARLATFL